MREEWALRADRTMQSPRGFIGAMRFWIARHSVIMSGQPRAKAISFEMMNKPYKIPESVLVVIHSADLDVLLIERTDKPGYWQSVTGSKDALDEPLRETAMREVFEETGIRVRDGALELPFHREDVPLNNLQDWQLSNIYDIYPVWRHRYAPGVTKNVEHVFGLQVPRDIPITLAPREHVNQIWLPYREAADKCFSPSNAEAILQLPQYLSENKKLF
jgi:dihydroneopterin triphosphate diphosphatase